MTTSGTRERILVLAPAGRDASLAYSALAQAGIAAAVCDNLDRLRDALDQGAGAALITEEAFLEWDAHRLAAWVAAQPPWSDLPIIVLLKSGGGEASHDIAFLKTAANITLLERPIGAGTLVSTIRAALRARKRQYEVGDTLQALAQSEERYRALADELERLVAVRTQSLAETNERLVREIAERERAENTLHQAQKLEAVGQLTAGVAHDFNNLLQAIMGNVENAGRQINDEAALRPLQRAIRAAERGAQLTGQLLAFSRKQLLKPQIVDLNAAVTAAGDMLFRTMGTAIRFETVLESGVWPALVDPTQIELILLNLSLNGRDAMPDGGRLTLKTANVRSAERPETLPPGDYVMIAVSDTGVGMSDVVRTRAFEPFFTTKEVGKGSGLGLSMVHGVATQSGGGVTIESNLGKGTTVRVYLPRAPADSVAAPSAEWSVAQVTGTNTILIVDDDPAVRQVTVNALQSLGYRTLEASNGRAALDLLRSVGNVDLLVADVAMPELNGVELVRLARERHPRLQALFVTGYTAAYSGDALKGDFLLQKPFSRDRLADAVAKALQHRTGPSSTNGNVVKLKPLAEQ